MENFAMIQSRGETSFIVEDNDVDPDDGIVEDNDVDPDDGIVEDNDVDPDDI